MNPLMNLIGISGGLVYGVGGISAIGYRFILDLPVYSSTEIVDKNVERNINTFF